MLGDFGVVALMRFETFSFAIYNQYSSATIVRRRRLALIVVVTRWRSCCWKAG